MTMTKVAVAEAVRASGVITGVGAVAVRRPAGAADEECGDRGDRPRNCPAHAMAASGLK
jgi:hypothetical protein